ncbi:MAG: CDP-glucose 4,6-dehydratase [Verrucomicrobiota bacterium]
MAFSNIYSGKTVLVTGHTGFKGSWLCTWLIRLGAQVHGLSDCVFESPSMFEELSLRDRIDHHEGDIRDRELVLNTFKNIQPDFVFHLAAQSIVSLSYKDPFETYTTNVIGTLNVLEALRAVEKPCFAVLITSDKCYHNSEWSWGYRETDRLGGKDPYSASKACAELVIHSSFESFFKDSETSPKLASTRAGNVIGGGDWKADRIVPDAARAWSENRAVTIRAPRATRPWQHVLEPLSGYLCVGEALASGQPFHGEAYNFGPNANQNKTVLDLLMELAKTWGPAESSPVNVEETQHFKEAGLLKLSCDKALADLDWIPVLDFEECARFTASWYETFYGQDQDIFQFTIEQLNQFESLAKERALRWAQG